MVVNRRLADRREPSRQRNRMHPATVKECGPTRASGGFVRVTVRVSGDVGALGCTGLGADSQPKEELHARRATVAPKIDGLLDDDLWSVEPFQLDRWMSYNPLRGEPEQQQTQVWVGLRQRGDLLRLSLLRRRAGQDPVHDQPPRQRVERRLGRREPRFEPRRADRVPHVRQPERHPDGRAPEHQRGHRTGLAVAERRPGRRRRLRRRDSVAAREHPIPRRSRRANGRCCFSGRTAAWASRGRGRK